jgi:1,2-diacylglycerol 3-alpha-glucosyltransferase
MISDVYFPRVNGVSTSIQTFRRQLAALGHEVVLIAPEYGAPQSDERDVVRVPSRYLVLDPEDRMMQAKQVRKLVPALRERSFDLMHIQTPFVAHYTGMVLADQLGLPRVETYHTFFEEYLFHYVPFVPRGWMRALARRFSRTQCNSLDAVVVPSHPMQAVLREYGVTVPLEVIPTGLELQSLAGGDGQAFRRRHGIESDRPTLVHVGRVAFEKNIDFLLRMLVRVRERVPEVLLVICGEGPSLTHLQRLATRLGVAGNVLFVGYLDRTKGLLDCYCAGGCAGRVYRGDGNARHPRCATRSTHRAGRRSGVRRESDTDPPRRESAPSVVHRSAQLRSGMERTADDGAHVGVLSASGGAGHGWTPHHRAARRRTCDSGLTTV